MSILPRSSHPFSRLLALLNSGARPEGLPVQSSAQEAVRPSANLQSLAKTGVPGLLSAGSFESPRFPCKGRSSMVNIYMYICIHIYGI